MVKSKVYRLTVDAHLISEGLLLPEAVVVSAFKDGRVASRFTEKWTAEIYQIKDAKPNQKGFDGVGTGESQFEYKTLTKGGTAFRRSSNTGKGRTCCSRDVKDFLEGLEAVIITDVTKFPELYFIKLRASVLTYWHTDAIINPNNGQISYERFWKAVGEMEVIEWPVQQNVPTPEKASKNSQLNLWTVS